PSVPPEPYRSDAPRKGGAEPCSPRWVAHRSGARPAPWARQAAPGPPRAERSGREWALSSDGLAPHHVDGPDDDRFEDRPADERRDGRDVEHRGGGPPLVDTEDADEWGHERLACVEDELHDVVSLARIEQQQDDPQHDQRLDDPEDQ